MAFKDLHKLKGKVVLVRLKDGRKAKGILTEVHKSYMGVDKGIVLDNGGSVAGGHSSAVAIALDEIAHIQLAD